MVLKKESDMIEGCHEGSIRGQHYFREQNNYQFAVNNTIIYSHPRKFLFFAFVLINERLVGGAWVIFS